MAISSHCSFELPAWVESFLVGWQRPLSSTDERMQLAIALSKNSVLQKTGGPFGAVVVNEQTGELVSVGINLVTTAGLSIAHAEMVALSLAQLSMGQWNLSHSGPLQLVTSCEPCAMCFGSIPWSGVRSVVIGATGAQVEQLTGFDEGPIHPDWQQQLHARGIRVSEDVLAEEAAAVLKAFGDSGLPVYNGRSGK